MCPDALGPAALMSALSSPSQRSLSSSNTRWTCVGVGGVGDQAERIRTPALGQVLCRPLEHSFRPADDGHPRTVLGEAARGCESHPATTADDDRGGVLQPEIHGA